MDVPFPFQPGDPLPTWDGTMLLFGIVVFMCIAVLVCWQEPPNFPPSKGLL